MNIGKIMFWLNLMVNPKAFQGSSISLPIMIPSCRDFLFWYADLFTHIFKDPGPNLIPETIGSWVKGGIKVKENG
jgi:hypothetical protein